MLVVAFGVLVLVFVIFDQLGMESFNSLQTTRTMIGLITVIGPISGSICRQMSLCRASSVQYPTEVSKPKVLQEKGLQDLRKLALFSANIRDIIHRYIFSLGIQLKI